MTQNTITLSDGCRFISNSYHTGLEDVTDVHISYTARATDYWKSDSETEVDIDRGKAREIVDFLNRAFGLEDGV